MKNHINRAILAFCLLFFFLESYAQVEVVADAASSGNTFIVNYPANFGTVTTPAITPGITITFKSNHNINGAAFLNLNSLGAKAIKKQGTLPLAANDIMAGQYVTVTYDGTDFQMTSVGTSAWSLTGNDGTTAGTNFIGTKDAIDFVFATGGVEKMRIGATGNVGIGVNPTAGYKLEVNGTFHSTGIMESSDIRWKKDILTIDNALTKVKQLRGVTYNWRITEFKDKNFTDKNQIGLIAQEVETIIPQAVNTDAEGYKSVEYSKLVALLIEAIKEQENKIEKLEKENASLKSTRDSEVNQLKAELKSLTNRLDAIDGGKKFSEK